MPLKSVKSVFNLHVSDSCVCRAIFHFLSMLNTRHYNIFLFCILAQASLGNPVVAVVIVSLITGQFLSIITTEHFHKLITNNPIICCATRLVMLSCLIVGI